MDANATAASHLRIRVNVRIISPLRVKRYEKRTVQSSPAFRALEEVMSAMARRAERDCAAPICIYRARVRFLWYSASMP